MSHIIDQIVAFYSDFSVPRLKGLDRVYHSEVVFIDPIHSIKGRGPLKAYFERVMSGVKSCSFEFKHIEQYDGSAHLEWVMTFRHPKLGANPIQLPGVSILRFDDKVHYHRDYYDLGGMLYEHVPVLGRVIRTVKQRLAGDL